MNDKDLILVIDMQKVYLPGKPWACEHAETVVSNISKLLDAVIDIKEGSANCAAPEVILTRFVAPSEEDAVGIWQEYNKVNQEVNENPVMEEFIPAIARYAEDFPYYDKCTYSCFSEPNVRAAADKAMVHGGDIVLTGVVSECCVLSTFFQGADLGYHFVYLKDACAGVNSDTEQAVEKVLKGLEYLHVDVMTTREYMDKIS